MVVFVPDILQSGPPVGESLWNPPMGESALQGAMKPFDLALGLGMTNPTVDQPDALLDQTDRQARQPPVVTGSPPWHSVIHQHLVGDSILLKRLSQSCFHARMIRMCQGVQTD